MSNYYKNVNALLWGLGLVVAWLVLSEMAQQAGSSVLELVLYALASV
jgi:hypothetical protein